MRIYRCTHVDLSLSMSTAKIVKRRCEDQAVSRFTVRWKTGKLSYTRLCDHHATAERWALGSGSRGADSLMWWFSEASI